MINNLKCIGVLDTYYNFKKQKIIWNDYLAIEKLALRKLTFKGLKKFHCSKADPNFSLEIQMFHVGQVWFRKLSE